MGPVRRLVTRTLAVAQGPAGKAMETPRHTLAVSPIMAHTLRALAVRLREQALPRGLN